MSQYRRLDVRDTQIKRVDIERCVSALQLDINGPCTNPVEVSYQLDLIVKICHHSRKHPISFATLLDLASFPVLTLRDTKVVCGTGDDPVKLELDMSRVPGIETSSSVQAAGSTTITIPFFAKGQKPMMNIARSVVIPLSWRKCVVRHQETGRVIRPVDLMGYLLEDGQVRPAGRYDILTERLTMGESLFIHELSSKAAHDAYLLSELQEAAILAAKMEADSKCEHEKAARVSRPFRPLGEDELCSSLDELCSIIGSSRYAVFHG